MNLSRISKPEPLITYFLHSLISQQAGFKLGSPSLLTLDLTTEARAIGTHSPFSTNYYS